MKSNYPASFVRVVAFSLLWMLGAVPQLSFAQAPPPKARANIHTLFDQHANVIRSVKLTEDGYVSLTESRDPEVAATLREHVSQMRKHLQDGKMIRGWDPAFREMVEHYDAIVHRVDETEHGLKVTVLGKTPEAVKVAQNHAKIVSEFAENGWSEHDVRHPRALVNGAIIEDKAAEGEAKCVSGDCCATGSKACETATGCSNCRRTSSR